MNEVLLQSLKQKLAPIEKPSLFYPDAEFYWRYADNHLAGLQAMAARLFEWLGLNPEGCTVDFKEGLKGSGFYGKVADELGQTNEVIYINKKYEKSALYSGAALARQMMQLYVVRKGIEKEDALPDELLIDLATIAAGLGILVVNGFSYTRHFRRPPLGYLPPYRYGKEMLEKIQKLQIQEDAVLGYLSPQSRNLLSGRSFTFFTVKGQTGYIRSLEKKQSETIAAVVVCAGVALCMCLYLGRGMLTTYLDAYLGIDKTNSVSQLQEQIIACESLTQKEEQQYKSDQIARASMESQLAQNGNSANDPLRTQYNALLAQEDSDYANYDKTLHDCNALIDQYNAGRISG